MYNRAKRRSIGEPGIRVDLWGNVDKPSKRRGHWKTWKGWGQWTPGVNSAWCKRLVQLQEK